MAGSEERPGSGGAFGGDAPGRLSRLLEDLVRAPGDDVPDTWRDALKPGERLDRFEIRRELGRGGFGAVYEAIDNELGRVVAIKTLRRGRSRRKLSTDWVKKEAEAVARLDHPCIVTLFDVGTHTSGPYLVMELLRGETLARRIEKGPLPLSEALRIGIEMAKGLAHAHQRGVLHLDLKPANVFLCKDGRVKLLDFGLAHLLGSPWEAGAGTPAYMAPEQARGDDADERSDIYAAGKVLEELLGDRRPRWLGSVLASATSADPSARPRDGAAWLDLLLTAQRVGERPSRIRRLVLIAGTAMLLGAALAALVARRSSRQPEMARAAPPASIAVLPFADLSPGKDQEYFSDGISEEILNALSRVEGLKVAGRTSSFSFRGRSDDLATIARKLHVGAVLEGSVRKDGTRLRISAQLVDAGDGYELWSATFDRELKGIFAVQEEIATAVVGALKLKLLQAPSSNRMTLNPEAYNQYLLGRQFFARSNPEDYRRALQACRKAVELDPAYAPAWAGLANAAYWVADNEGSPAAVKAGQDQALAAAEKAVALRPDLADGYQARGFLRAAVQFDWAGGEEDLQHALALGPEDVDTLRNYAQAILRSTGRLEAEVAALQRAIEIDPLNARCWSALGGALTSLGRFAAAQEALDRSQEISPEQSINPWYVSRNYLLEGRPADALAAAQRSSSDLYRLLGAALAQHDLGHERESQLLLDELIAKGSHNAAYQIAEVYAWRGDKERAFEWLERARAQRDGGLTSVKADPLFRGLQSDPRWGRLLRSVNLAAY